jgi:hypothetical protein
MRELDGGVQLLLLALVHLLDKLRAFVELVPFSMILVASHGCTLLKLLHHGITVILRRFDFAIHVLRNVHLFLIVLALAHQACQPLSEPFHFLLKLIIFLTYETITCFYNNILIQDGEQDSSIKSMQEVEASTLEIGIAQGIDDSSSSKELFVLVSLL